MYKKKLTKSFFDASNDHESKSRRFPYNSRDKENQVPASLDDKQNATSISGATLSKLNTFAYGGEVHTENASHDLTNPSQAQPEEVQELHSSQAEDRVKWRISPPPMHRSNGSAQKLTINEMFDIYQASQHSSATPVRRLDPTGDLWSRYDSAEPLPYLDLELSPALHKTPKSEAKLRRTTSLPSWSVERRERKKRKVSPKEQKKKNCENVLSMMERVQQALMSGLKKPELEPHSTTEKHLTSVNPEYSDNQNDNGHTNASEHVLPSDDYGSDDLDPALLFALPDLQTPVQKSKISALQPQAIVETNKIVEHSRVKPEGAIAHVGKENVVLAEPLRRTLGSPGSSSNYSLDLDEQDFLEASQMLFTKETSLANPIEQNVPLTGHHNAKNKALTPAELLEGLENDVFSDFEEEPMQHKDNTMHVVTSIISQEYAVGNRSRHRLLLSLSDSKERAKSAVLEDDWADIELHIADQIRFHGHWKSSTHFVATNLSGLLVVHPDVLVSCTAVSDSHTCLRKSVLQDRVRATSMLSKATLFGSILHSVLQASLLDSDFSDQRMRKEIGLQIQGNMEKLYLVDESIQSAEAYLYEKMILLQQWANKFFGHNKKGKVEPMRGKGKLQEVAVSVKGVLEIEERFWSPLFGLKGNVDVSAEMTVDIDEQKTVVTAPLEFKTGKAEYQQSSYRAQVMLYTLMMSERYNIDVSAGFLYYLESGQITRVAALHNEVRGLILIRNEVARHMKQKLIPPMISNKRLCGMCYASEACFTYHKTLEDGNEKSSGLEGMFDSKTAHLGERDISFFKHWESLITREEGEMYRFRNELWHMTSKEREKVNRCFGNLLVLPHSESFDSAYGKMNQWTYKLRHALPGHSFLESQISEREPIIISDEEGRYAISCGFIADITRHTITVNVDRPLRDSRAKQPDFDEKVNQVFKGTQAAAGAPNKVHYRIDRDEFKNGMGIVRNNLIALMLHSSSKNASPAVERQRNLIVDLAQPKFDSKPSASLSTISQSGLNVDQVRAKELIMSARDYALILGMPGTGKTTTIAQIIKSLVDAGRSVLLTSYTHSAVDTIILKLARHKIPILRLGGFAKIHPEVVKIATTERHDYKTFEEIDEHYNSPSVVATTCLSINHAIFQKRRFDYCIFDEASQATLPVCLGPLRFADRFVLVGDHYQLPPLVKDYEARKAGLDVSLFKILCEAHPEAVVELKHQYRMNADIMSISNALIYNRRLTCGTEALKLRKLENLNMECLASLHDQSSSSSRTCKQENCWLEHVIDPERRVIYLNTDSMPEAAETKTRDQITNQCESNLVSHIVEGFLRCGLRDLDIGVISPYRSQLKIIQQELKRHPQVIVDTADKFQGRDKDCIIISLVRSNKNMTIGDLLKDWRRINVAFTRAKSKMVIIGSQETLACDALLNAFLHLVHQKGWAYDLPEHAHTMHLATKPATQITQEQGSRDWLNLDRPQHKKSVGSPDNKVKREVRVVTAGRRAVLANRPILQDLIDGL